MNNDTDLEQQLLRSLQDDPDRETKDKISDLMKFWDKLHKNSVYQDLISKEMIRRTIGLPPPDESIVEVTMMKSRSYTGLAKHTPMFWIDDEVT